MTNYQPLTSEKYYHDSLRQEFKARRREKNRQAAQAFGQFLFVLVVFLFTVTAVQQMPAWLPEVTAWMDQNGITATVQSWVDHLS